MTLREDVLETLLLKSMEQTVRLKMKLKQMEEAEDSKPMKKAKKNTKNIEDRTIEEILYSDSEPFLKLS